MDHAKKMVLVPFKKIDQLNTGTEHRIVNPLSNKLLSLDDRMGKILQNNKLTDVEKIDEYTKAMQLYMEYHKKLSGPTQFTPVGTIVNTETDTSNSDKHDTESEKLTGSDKEYKSKDMLHDSPKKHEINEMKLHDSPKEHEISEMTDLKLDNTKDLAKEQMNSFKNKNKNLELKVLLVMLYH